MELEWEVREQKQRWESRCGARRLGREYGQVLAGLLRGGFRRLM